MRKIEPTKEVYYYIEVDHREGNELPNNMTNEECVALRESLLKAAKEFSESAEEVKVFFEGTFKSRKKQPNKVYCLWVVSAPNRVLDKFEAMKIVQNIIEKVVDEKLHFAYLKVTEVAERIL